MDRMPREGDKVVRTEDGASYVIEKVVEAGGEEVYRLRPEAGGEGLEITGASFVKEHDQDRAAFDLV